MSLIKRVCAGFFVILVLLLGGIAFFLGTTKGIHMLVHGAARWITGLDISSVNGNWRDLTLKGVKYQMSGVLVSVGRFRLGLDLSCLKKSSFCINMLDVDDVNVVVDTTKLPPSTSNAEEKSAPLGKISTPYPITLRRLTLNNINVKIDNNVIALGHFQTGARWQKDSLTITPTVLHALQVTLPKTLPVPATKKESHPPSAVEPLADQLNKLFAKPLLPDLPDVHLPLNITLEKFSADQLHLTGDTNLQIDNLLLKAQTHEQQIVLKTLEVKSPQGQLSLHGNAALSAKWPLALTLKATSNIAPLQGQTVAMDVKGKLYDKLQATLHLAGPINAQLDLETQLAQAGLPLSLTVQSKQLNWPLSGAAEYQVSDYRLHLSGKATDYKLAMNALVKGKTLLPAQIALEGNGNTEQFKLDKLHLGALQGSVDLKGLVDWKKALSWDAQLAINGINTEKQWPDWPVKLDGKVSTTGTFSGDSWQLQVPTLSLKGEIKKNVISAQGSITGNSAGLWDIPGIELILGRNHLNVAGKLTEQQWQLDGNIDAPQLDGLLPGLAGKIAGFVHLRGNLANPELTANLNADGLRWQTLHIDKIKLTSSLQSDKQIQGQLALQVDNLKQGTLVINHLMLDVKGNEKQHQLQLSLEGEPVSGELALTGSFDRSQMRWHANINTVSLDTPVCEWRLTRTLTIDYQLAKQQVSIGPHCWLNPNAELCVPNQIELGASGGEASVVLNRFDLAALKPVLGPATELSGILTGKAFVSWKKGQALPQANISLIGNGVKVVQQIEDNKLPLAFDELRLNANTNNGRIQADWLVKLSQNGQFDGQIELTDPMGQRNIAGSINISRISLAAFNSLLTDGDQAKGMINANLRLAGNARKPLVYGRFAIEDVGAQGHWMPFDMTNSRLVMNFNGQSSILEGIIATTQGQLNLNGNADWYDPKAWRARIAARGSRVRLSLPPMVRLDVSPDIVFEATPQLFSLAGSIDVPWARITVQELPESAVAVSSDEVMLDNNLKPIKSKNTTIPISSQLMIHVGDNVRLNAFGLKARLTGDLKVVQDKNGLGLNGQIDIPSGRFHAYGQDLLVRKGQLMFSGPPEQPLLNLEAIRNPEATEDDVVAGVRVTGFADAPKLEIFSDPAKSQEEALSYLLRGQGLENSDMDSNAMTSMLIGLGVAQSGQLMGKIGQAFGVSNLALDTAGVGDSSQVVVSGYVLPGLQVKYGVGIFDSLATLTLRYRLMPKLYLEAVSGIDQALDLLYQFEF